MFTPQCVLFHFHIKGTQLPAKPPGGYVVSAATHATHTSLRFSNGVFIAKELLNDTLEGQ